MRRGWHILGKWIDSPWPGILLLFYIFINFSQSTVFYFRTPQYRLELLISALVAGILLRLRWRCLWHFIALLTATSGTFFFLETTQGNLIFTDDHPSFFYRLTQLKENFPYIPFYNPMWNAGVEAREFFPSGVLNIYLLFYPLITFFPVDDIYNFIVILVLFFVTPGSFWYSAKLLELPAPARAVAAVLSITSSLYWYRWALAYGTMGFILSMALLPLAVTLTIRIFDQKKSASTLEIVLWAIVGTLTALWSMSLIAMLPMLLLICRRWHNLVSRPLFFGIALLTLVINGLWILIFIHASNVFKFIGSDTQTITQAARKSTNSSIFEILQYGFENLQAASPLIVVLFISAVVRCCKTPSLQWYGAVILWVLSISLIGPLIKPHLELERFMITAILLSVLPVAYLCSDALSNYSKNLFTAALASLIFGFIFIGPRWIQIITTNQSAEQFTVRNTLVDQMIDAVKNYGGEGRVLFAGFVLHELSGGHVAPLPYFTGYPIVASSYQHDRWQYADIMAKEYRTTKVGVNRFLDIHNVSAIITLNKVWRKWFDAQPDEYELQWEAGLFKLFKRKNFQSNYFLSGSGEIIKQDGNALTVRVDSSEVVLKFKYYWFLKSSSCDISGTSVDKEYSFIKLSNCSPGEVVNIRATSPLTRLFVQSRQSKLLP